MTAPYEFFGGADLFPTIEAGKEWLAKVIWESRGGVCPLCGRLDKVYRRAFGRTQMNQLTKLHNISMVDEFRHYRDFDGTPSDFPKLEHVGLIERQSNDDPAKSGSGFYRITTKGHKFLRNEVSIPAVIWIYHGEVVQEDDEQKLFKDIWPEFDYRDLWRNHG